MEEELAGEEWMCDIWLTTLSHLTMMSISSKFIGTPDTSLDLISWDGHIS